MSTSRIRAAICASVLLASSLPLLAQGTIEGHVKVTGPTKANARIPMGADPNCLQINTGKRVVQETIVRAGDGGLANVFGYVKGSFPSSAASTPNAFIDQRGCTYHPRVQGARTGQMLEVKNSDTTLHNIHSMTTKGNAFNTGQPTAGMVFRTTLKSEEVMLHVKCDVHPWMTGYIGVVSHPYYAVSDATGTFKIANVPAGKQTVTVWHEQFGPLTQTVDVKSGATAVVNFAYTGAEKPATAAALPMQEIVIPAGAIAVELLPRSSDR
jgi:ribosomal protein L31